MDLRRVSSLLLLSETFKMNAGYVVRQIADQEEREFVDWKIINIKKFNAYASSLPFKAVLEWDRKMDIIPLVFAKKTTSGLLQKLGNFYPASVVLSSLFFETLTPNIHVM